MEMRSRLNVSSERLGSRHQVPFIFTVLGEEDNLEKPTAAAPFHINSCVDTCFIDSKLDLLLGCAVVVLGWSSGNQTYGLTKVLLLFSM